MALRLIAGPAAEPVALAEAIAHLRLPPDWSGEVDDSGTVHLRRG